MPSSVEPTLQRVPTGQSWQSMTAAEVSLLGERPGPEARVGSFGGSAAKRLAMHAVMSRALQLEYDNVPDPVQELPDLDGRFAGLETQHQRPS